MTSPYLVGNFGDRFEITAPEGVPPLRFHVHASQPAMVLDGGRFHELDIRSRQTAATTTAAVFGRPDTFAPILP